MKPAAKSVLSFAAALVATQTGWAFTPTPVQTEHFTSRFEGSQFLSSWPGYQNNAVNLGTNYQLNTRDMVLGVDLRISSRASQPVLGNIEQLSYSRSMGSGWETRIGRDNANLSQVLLPFAAHDRLNAKVCYTAFECARGGPIGAGLRYGRVSLFVSGVSIPDIHPALSLDENGQLHSRDRWAEAPIQTVEIDGHQLPLRVGASLAGDASVFFRPGARLSADLSPSSHHKIALVSQFAPSQQLTIHEDQKLGFEAMTNGQAQVVVHDVRTAELSYEQIHSLQGESTLNDDLRLQGEIAYAGKVNGSDQAFTAFTGLSAPLTTLTPKVGFGVHRADRRTTSFIQSSFEETWHSWIMRMQVALILANGSQGIWLTRTVGYRFSRTHSVELNGSLIRAKSDALFLGSIRGNDQISLGWIYAF